MVFEWYYTVPKKGHFEKMPIKDGILSDREFKLNYLKSI